MERNRKQVSGKVCSPTKVPVLIKHFSMGAMGQRAERFYPEKNTSVIVQKTVGIVWEAIIATGRSTEPLNLRSEENLGVVRLMS